MTELEPEEPRRLLPWLPFFLAVVAAVAMFFVFVPRAPGVAGLLN